MEVVLKCFQEKFLASIAARFNPCFDGSGSEITKLELRIGIKDQVSILVLMEVVLKFVIDRPDIEYTSFRFNPCFDGSGSEIDKPPASAHTL